jgi:hypothetical protein
MFRRYLRKLSKKGMKDDADGNSVGMGHPTQTSMFNIGVDIGSHPSMGRKHRTKNIDILKHRWY